MISQERNNGNVFVFIEDFSSNGTFLNGDKIGKGRRSILKNNDEIALSMPKNKGSVTSMPILRQAEFQKKQIPDKLRGNLETKLKMSQC